MGVSL